MIPIKEYIKHPEIAGYRVLQQYFTWLPDKLYIQLMFRFKMGYWPNLKNPQSFSEKLQWLKLNYRRPEYTTIVDKYAVKDYVAKIIGEKFIIPTLGVWDKPEDIDWESLPDRFVLKTTHGGGSTGVVICKEKTSFDKGKAIDKLNKSLIQDIYRTLKEWPYKNVPRRILAEQYIEPLPETQDLPDFKWYCFGGEPKYCQVITNRSSEETIDFFDTDWNHQDFIGLLSVNTSFKNADLTPERPSDLDEQVRIAKELSKGLPFSRIDLYSINNKTYFGEITFYPASGLGTFEPSKYNEILGKKVLLPRAHEIK